MLTTRNEDPEYSESEDEVDDRHPGSISAKRASVGKSGNSKRKKGHDMKDATLSQSPSSNDGDEPSTVIYLGHLPVGFEEREITVFLNQFGNLNRCRVSRSTKTGRSRCYAFVEFADPEVARIVADTMSGYLLLEKRLVCHVLPRDKVDHELMFARPKRVPTKKDRQKKARSEVNKVRNADAIRGITARLVKREEMKRKKLEALGIEYDFPGYAASAAAAAAKPSGTATTESKKDDDVNTTKKKKKRKLSKDGDDGKENAKSGDEPVKTSLESLKKKEKNSKKGGLKEKIAGQEDETKEIKVKSDLAEEKKKSRKVVLREKSGGRENKIMESGEKNHDAEKSAGEEEERMEIDVTNDLAEEKMKKKKKLDLKENSGGEENKVMESGEKNHHAEEKEKLKNVDLKEKSGGEKDKRQIAKDRNEDAANGESAKKKASKRKSKTPKIG